MPLKDRLDQDLKTALLAGDKQKATVLRGLKSVILYEEVAQKVRDTGLSDEAITQLFQKEAKKRQESAELYTQGSSPERAQAELAEKSIIEEYLPAQLDEAAIRQVVDDVVAKLDNASAAAMGQVIGAVKQKTAGAADGATIARLVKERLAQ